MSSSISQSFNDLFNPYSKTWEVSGTSTPTWTWKLTPSGDVDDNGNQVYYAGFVELKPSEVDSNKKEAVDHSSYDVRTNNIYAPFSQFSRWQMLDYTGIKGVMYSGDMNVTNRYFDIGLARSGELWSTLEPTYSNIIEVYNNIDAARYKIQDFIYNKYFNMIPTNYLITLRRYAMPCLDAPFTLSFDEKTYQKINSRAVLIPISTATTYMSDICGNKMDDILKFAFGMNFSEKSAEIQTITSGTPGATGFGYGSMLDNIVQKGNEGIGSAIDAGLSMSALNFLGSTSLTPAQSVIASQWANVDPWAKYSKYTQGPVDVIMKTMIRDQGLNFTNDFNLKFEYELKSLNYVNPKIAMLDIIGNMITMSTNSGSFWGGATRYYGNGGGYGKQPGDLTAFARGDYKTYATSIADHVVSQVESLNGGGLPNDLQGWLKLAANFLKGSFGNMLGSLINGNLGKLGFTQPANALLSDEPTGYWHVTIGNPLNPIAMMGNMLLKDMNMQMGEGLGYDDFPINVSFTCNLQHGKPRDAAAIEAIFNAGKGRYMHTPFLAEIENLPSDMKQEVHSILQSMRNKKDPMHISGGVSDPTRNEYSNISENDKKTKISTSKISMGDYGTVKNLNSQLDTVIQLMR